MAPTRKRENRGNQFYDVGVQGRKTGITLEDRGVRDEHGLEPISGIFSSPQKSPPRRGASNLNQESLAESESMDIQESTIPDLATSTQLLRNSRTHFPPPKSRSPIKTALKSSPRRSSMGPRVQSVNRSSSPIHAASHPAVNRVLDFEQEESVLQNNSALSGSGQHRGSRQSIYDIEQSPSDGEGAAQEEAIFENVDMEDSAMLDGIIEESYDDDVENEANIGADAEVDVEVEETEEPEEPEETEVATEIPKPPAKRGRKRKSEAMEPPIEDDTPRSRRRGATSAQASKTQKGKKGAAPAEEALPRRSKRVSEIFDEESSISMDVSGASIVAVESPPVVAKRRGRSLKNKAPVEPVEPVEAPAPAPKKKKSSKEKVQQQEKSPEEPQPIEPEEPEEHVFKKPKSVSKPKKKTEPKPVEKESEQAQEAGKLVTVLRKPISKEDMDQMSATSTGTRYGRGRHLSIYRELEPDKVATVGQTGRHRVKPIDFWRNESIAYDWKRDMKVILRKEYEEPPPSKYKSKGNKRKIAAIEDEEEIELEPWEAQNGTFEGLFRDYDAIAEVASDGLLEACMAWAPKGINPANVADASFKFTKLGSAGAESWLSWGFIVLEEDQMKRTKNSRRMHMVFHVESGAVEVKVHENVFTVHRGGVFQVPRGNTYSMKNAGTSTCRVFFTQAYEKVVTVNDEEED